jgi:hypothetical protein
MPAENLVFKSIWTNLVPFVLFFPPFYPADILFLVSNNVLDTARLHLQTAVHGHFSQKKEGTEQPRVELKER